MAHDSARAVPQPVRETAGPDIARLPTPRPPVLEPAAPVIAQPAARPSSEPAAHDVTAPGHGSPAGWIVLTVVAAAAAYAVGWVAGVSWAWREMTPRYLSRTHRRRGAGLPGAPSLARS
jgi:hypothetical protein